MSLRLALGPLMQQGVVGGSYQSLVESHGAASYWPLQSALTNGGTETDQTDSNDLTWTSTGASSPTATGPGGDLTSSTGISSGTGQYGFQTDNLFDMDQDWSVSFWLTQTSNQTFGCALRLNNTSASNYCYVIHRDDRSGLTLQISDASGVAKYIDFGTSIEADSTWHHVAVVRDYNTTASSDTITLYLDGASVAGNNRNTLGWRSSFTDDEARFGAINDAGSLPWLGYFAGAAHFPGVILSGAQVLAQYQEIIP